MSGFPPTLLSSATRDFRLSPVVATHAQLARLGVHAQLHVYEGLGHCFHYNLDLPESKELYRATIQFFEQHLA